MILSDVHIREALSSGRIRISPEPDLGTQLGSVSIDFRLGTTFMVFEHSRYSFIDPRSPIVEYRTQGGDSISGIAQRYGVAELRGVLAHECAALFQEWKSASKCKPY